MITRKEPSITSNDETSLFLISNNISSEVYLLLDRS